MTSGMGLFDMIVSLRLWNTTKEMVRAFYEPSPLLSIPAGLGAAALVAGVFLVVGGAALAAAKHGRMWRLSAVATAAAIATWVIFGGGTKVAGFFSVILLLLKFLGG